MTAPLNILSIMRSEIAGRRKRRNGHSFTGFFLKKVASRQLKSPLSIKPQGVKKDDLGA